MYPFDQIKKNFENTETRKSGSPVFCICFAKRDEKHLTTNIMGVLEINTPLEKVSRTLSFKKKIVKNFSLQRIVSVFLNIF